MAAEKGRVRVTLALDPVPCRGSPVVIAPGRPVVRQAVNDYRAPWRHVVGAPGTDGATGRRWRRRPVSL